MKEDDLLNITSSIEQKVGKEIAATISDDLGNLITKNSEALDELNKRNEEINNLKSTNEKLIRANGSLLKQVQMGDREDYNPDSKPESSAKKSINLKDCFDARGNFIH